MNLPQRDRMPFHPIHDCLSCRSTSVRAVVFAQSAMPARNVSGYAPNRIDLAGKGHSQHRNDHPVDCRPLTVRPAYTAVASSLLLGQTSISGINPGQRPSDRRPDGGSRTDTSSLTPDGRKHLFDHRQLAFKIVLSRGQIQYDILRVFQLGCQTTPCMISPL